MITDSFDGAIALKGFIFIFSIAFIFLKIKAPEWVPRLIGTFFFGLLIYLISIINGR